jgi:hypothetical protein
MRRLRSTPVDKQRKQTMPKSTEDYDAPAPGKSSSTQPTSSAQSPADPPELVQDMATTTLEQWRASLRHPIPGDPSFAAAVAGVLGMLLDKELRHPARKKRDAEAAKAREEELKKEIEERQKAQAAQEKAAKEAADKAAAASKANP